MPWTYEKEFDKHVFTHNSGIEILLQFASKEHLNYLMLANITQEQREALSKLSETCESYQAQILRHFIADSKPGFIYLPHPDQHAYLFKILSSVIPDYNEIQFEILDILKLATSDKIFQQSPTQINLKPQHKTTDPNTSISIELARYVDKNQPTFFPYKGVDLNSILSPTSTLEL